MPFGFSILNGFGSGVGDPQGNLDVVVVLEELGGGAGCMDFPSGFIFVITKHQ